MFAEDKHDRSVPFQQLRSHRDVTELQLVADDGPAEQKASSSVVSDILKT